MSPRPYLIAGPCSAESREQVLLCARELKSVGTDAFRAGLWKPRSHPGSFEGVGEKGLPWLTEVRDETGLRVCTEVASAAHVEACLRSGIDMFWIGSRTTANPFLLDEIASALKGGNVRVLVKNPIGPDIESWTGAIERLLNAGITDVAAVLRGCAPSVGEYRNDPYWPLAVKFRTRMPRVPLYCDPSHIAGKASLVAELSRKALNLGMDGLMVECHPNPSEALSDASQQITPSEFGTLVASLGQRDSDSKDLEMLRQQIDLTDGDLLRCLSRRMQLSREIALCKKESGAAIMQPDRWEKVLSGVLSAAQEEGLDPELVRTVFSALHEASVIEQNSIIE